MALPSVDPNAVLALAAAYGITLTDTQAEALPVLIAKAFTLLPPGVETWLDAGTTDPAVVVSVVEDMVVRVLRNPRAFRQVSIDDFSATVDNALSAGALYLADDELARITPATKRRRVGTMRVGLLPHRVPQC